MGAYLVTCGIPIGWVVLCGAGFAVTLMITQRRMIFRILPLSHFGDDPSGYSKVKFWHDEPLEMRRVWKYKVIIVWPIILFAGGAIIYVCSYLLMHVAVTVT
jgi:hypothetical protein